MLGLNSYISDSKGDRFDLSDVSGLVSHLQAGIGFSGITGNAVDRWYDRSRSENWDSPASGNRPILVDGGGLDFDGVNDVMNITEFTVDTFHLFMVIDLDGSSNENVFGVTSAANFLRFNRGGVVNRMGYKFGNPATDKTVVCSQNIPTTKFLFELTRSDAASNNLVTFFSETSVGTTTLDHTKSWRIESFGAVTPGGANPAEGKIYELAIYNDVLSGSDLTNVRNDIKSRNGL